jgi:hypothetical protein
MTLVIIYCILSVIIVSAILIKLKWNDKCTIGDLLWGLFLVVLSPASLIVIIIVELIDSGFFKKKFINYGIRKRNLSYH